MAEIERIDMSVSISPIEAPDGGLARPTGAILSGLPPGAVPSAGFPYGDGEWLLNRDDLDGLTVSLPKAQADNFKPTVMAVYEDARGEVNTYDAAPFEVAPAHAEASTAGGKAEVIPLDVSIAISRLGADDQVYDVTVTGVPAGARLSTGIDNGDGSWTLLPEQFDDVSLILPEGFAGELTLAYSAIGIAPDGNVHSHNEVADFWIEDTAGGGFSFGPGYGHEHFVGHGSADDVVHLVGVSHGPSDEISGRDDWTLILDDASVTATASEHALEFDGEASGSILLGDGSELTFVDVTRIDW